MSAILKFDFQKKKTIMFFWSILSKLHKKDPILHVTNYIFPKTRGNKNKQWTHSTAVKFVKFRLLLKFTEEEHINLSWKVW